MTGLFTHIRQVTSPVTSKMLSPLENNVEIVQFNDPLSDRELKRLSGFLDDYPDVMLRYYGHGTMSDLEWLRYFPGHRNFAVDDLRLETLDGLRHLPETLNRLAIGQTNKRISLQTLERFPNLKTLYLESHTKDIEVLSRLTRLEDLTLRSITLPDLSILLPLERLWSLDLKLGGTRNLELLPEIGSLKYLELWMIRGLDDISAVGRLDNLRFLFLQAMRQVTSLPDFSRCTKLRRIHLETMKGLADLRPLLSAPALEELLLIDMAQLKPEDVVPLQSHRSLNAIRPGLGSMKRNQAVVEMLGLSDVSPPAPDLFD